MSSDQNVKRLTIVLRLALILLLLSASSFFPLEHAEAAFPGRNGKIAFERNSEIYVMNADGTGETFLGTSGLSPAWSPDGQRIVFSDFGKIRLMSADGTGHNSAGYGYDPAWSPDGKKITFVDGDLNICMMNADGSGVTRLTTRPETGSDHDPAWSPDGSKLAFARITAEEYVIYVMNADGSGQTRLSLGAHNDDREPAWSPDGKKMAFASDRDEFGNYDIYVMNAGGTGVTRLTFNRADEWAPAWTPDGSKIAFVSTRDGNGEIYVMNADGSDQTRLTNNPASDSHPDWQPITPAITTVPTVTIVRSTKTTNTVILSTSTTRMASIAASSASQTVGGPGTRTSGGFDSGLIIWLAAVAILVSASLVVILVVRARAIRRHPRVCASCGFTNPPYARAFCVKCGNPLEAP